MNICRTTRLLSAGLLGWAALLFASGACMGFGGVGVGGIAVGGVGVGGIAVGGRAGGIGIGVSVAPRGAAGGVTGAVGVPSGGGVATGASAAVGSGGATAGGDASVGGGAVTASGGASVGSDGATVGGNATVSSNGATVGSSAGAELSGDGSGAAAGISATGAVSASALAAQRAVPQIGVGPVEPDRGMAQALGYDAAAAAVVISTADTALNSAVSGMPALPAVTPAAEAATSEAPAPKADSPAPTADEGTTRLHSSRARGAVRHADPRPARHHVATSAIAFNVSGGPAALSALKKPDKAAPKAGADAAADPSAALQVVTSRDAAGTPVDPHAAPMMAIGVDASPLDSDPATQRVLAWNITGLFPHMQRSSLPTGLAIALAMVLSAASAWGFVRLMSERCPQCSALLERHCAGCRKCGARLHSPGHPDLRLSA